MDAVVLASHLAGEGAFRSQKYTVKPWLCREDEVFDYWRGLLSVWDFPGIVLNAEHDVEFTDDHLDELLRCPHPQCSYQYPCHWASTGRFDDVWPARNEQPGSNGLAVFVETGTEWAAQSAIGLVKLTPESRVGPLEQAHWSRLEVSVENATKRPWHLHFGAPYGPNPPLKHHHW